MQSSRKAQAEYRLGLLLALGALVWIGTYSSLAKGLTPFLSPVTLLLISESLIALFTLMTFGVVPVLKALSKMRMKFFFIAVALGLLNSTLGPYLWFTGLSMTTATNASLLSSIEFIWAVYLSYLLLGEHINRMQFVGMFVVLIGILVINLTNLTNLHNMQAGDMLVLLGAMSIGTGSVIFKKYLSHFHPELIILIRNFTGIVSVLLFTALVDFSISAELSSFPGEKVFLLIAFAFFSRYLALNFAYQALERLPASTFALIYAGAPITGVLFASLILGEQIFAYHIVGGTLILFGLVIEQTSARTIRRIGSSHFWNRFRHASRKHHTATSLPVLPKRV